MSPDLWNLYGLSARSFWLSSAGMDGAASRRLAIPYPYHYGDTDPAKVTALLSHEPEIQVRIRKMA